MGSGLHEWALVVFTVLAQSAVCTFTLLSLFLLTSQGKQQMARTHYTMTALWVLMAIGFTFSTLHLGSPHRAFNALNRIGLSNLSNEIATGSAFFALGAGYWVIATLPHLPSKWQHIGFIAPFTKLSAKLTAWLPLLRMLVILVGFVFVYAMSALYRIPTVPTWNSIFTPVGFVLTAVVAGSALTACLLRSANIGKQFRQSVLLLTLVGIIATVVATYFHYAYLARVNTAIHQALNLVPSYVPVMAMRFGLLLVGLALLWRGVKAGWHWALLGTLMIFIAEMLARTLFYSTHMTIGLKALGH